MLKNLDVVFDEPNKCFETLWAFVTIRSKRTDEIASQYYGPTHKILVLITSLSRQGSAESTHMHSLARSLASHIHKVQ